MKIEITSEFDAFLDLECLNAILQEYEFNEKKQIKITESIEEYKGERGILLSKLKNIMLDLKPQETKTNSSEISTDVLLNYIDKNKNIF